MLWYKHWLETRSRFLISLPAIAAICCWFIYHWNRNPVSWATAEYYNTGFYAAYNTLAVVWLLAVTLLAMGGLVRERASGSVGLTLALPVSRTRLTMVRIAGCLVQAIVLALVPCAAMLLAEKATARGVPYSQALFFLVLLLGGGLLFLALAILISSIVAGEYTAPLVCLGLIFAGSLAAASSPFRSFSPWTFMVGAEYFNRNTGTLVGPIPWMQFAVYIGCASLLLVAAMLAIEKREF